MNYHFLFDYDGVLIHKVNFAQSLYERHGINPEKIGTFFQSHLQACLIGKADMLTLLEEHLEAFEWDKGAKKLFEALYLEDNQYNLELLDFIRNELREPFACYIATNQDAHRYQAILDEPISAELFKEVFSSSELGVAKPNILYFEKIYTYLLNQNPTLEKEQVVFIDDLKENVDAASNFGFHTFLYKKQEDFINFFNDFLF